MIWDLNFTKGSLGFFPVVKNVPTSGGVEGGVNVMAVSINMMDGGVNRHILYMTMSRWQDDDGDGKWPSG